LYCLSNLKTGTFLFPPLSTLSQLPFGTPRPFPPFFDAVPVFLHNIVGITGLSRLLTLSVALSFPSFPWGLTSRELSSPSRGPARLLMRFSFPISLPPLSDVRGCPPLLPEMPSSYHSLGFSAAMPLTFFHALAPPSGRVLPLVPTQSSPQRLVPENDSFPPPPLLPRFHVLLPFSGGT